MRVNDPEYQTHAVFDQLDRHINFYKDLAESVMMWYPPGTGTKSIVNVDSYLFSSIQGTVSSIQLILKTGRINDAYTLLRKYYDSVIISTYTSIYLSENFSIDNLVVSQINDWLNGKKQLPEYRTMNNYIHNSNCLKSINAILFADKRYKRLRDRCNDHTHYNFYQNVLLNDNEICLPHRIQWLDRFSTDLRDVLIFHICYLFFASEHYMISSDYVDFLECGLTPEPDSQYWVAPFVQVIFRDVVSAYRNDLSELIKQHTSLHID
jgi:hypothetical protein